MRIPITPVRFFIELSRMKGRGRGSLTRLRPIKSVTVPFTRAAIMPPTVNIELKSEYCNTKKLEECEYKF